METKNKIENPPAFACVSGKSTEEGSFLQEGMTLRDYFAAKALQGMMANPNIQRPHPQNGDMAKQLKDFTAICFEYADSMLSERSQEKH